MFMINIFLPSSPGLVKGLKFEPNTFILYIHLAYSLIKRLEVNTLGALLVVYKLVLQVTIVV